MQKISSNIHSKFQGDCHYLQCGEINKKHALVFLHGIPTHSFIWRHVLADLCQYGNCIAPDLLGLGKSKVEQIPKSDKSYTIYEHIRFIENFLETLQVEKYTLVMHGWGSIIGSDYARRFPNKIKGLVYFESHLRPTHSPDMLSLPMQELSFTLMHEENLEELILRKNFFIETFLPQAMIGQIDSTIMDQYRQPFIDEASRYVLLRYIYELPLGHRKDSSIVELVEQYSQFLQETEIPKCLMFSMPGLMTTMATVIWAKEHLPNLHIADLGEGMHCAQETCPDRFNKALKDWLDKNQ